MDVHMSLFVSPIVFPLAFSINGKFYKLLSAKKILLKLRLKRFELLKLL